LEYGAIIDPIAVFNEFRTKMVPKYQQISRRAARQTTLPNVSNSFFFFSFFENIMHVFTHQVSGKKFETKSFCLP